jgi:DNA-binding MarR family transcriptional regulator
VLICDISILHKYGKQALDKQLLSLGFSWQEMVVLMVLEMESGADQALFSVLLQTDKGNVTRLLNAMEEKGLIARNMRNDDYRRKEIHLTASGAAKLPALHEAMGCWEAACFMGLNPEQIAGFQEASQFILGNMMANHQKNTNGEEEKK